MAIGVMSDEEYLAELNKLNRRTEVVDKPVRGRGEGTPNVPDSLRKIIGEESVINGRASALQIASEFGISPSSVSAYAVGATSTKTYDNPVKSLIGHINKSRQRAIKRASKTLNSALSSISQEKLDYADAKDLSSIAKDMSVIIKNLEPQSVESSNETSQPRFVIYAPQFKQENSFESIVVNE
jgi:predicted transcriptional regulator